MYALIIIFCFSYSFDDSNTEKLRATIKENDVDMHLFNFDTKCIDWEDYIMNTHIPGPWPDKVLNETITLRDCLFLFRKMLWFGISIINKAIATYLASCHFV